MRRASLYFFLAISMANLIGQLMGIESLQQMTKPLVIVALAAYYLAGPEIKSRVLLFALFFSWLGDGMLMIEGGEFFIYGLLAFLVSHLFYLATYRQHRTETGIGLQGTQIAGAALPVALAGVGLVAILYPHAGSLALPVTIYAAVVTLMVLQALFRWGYTTTASFWIVFAGAVLFMVSDSILAIDRFLSPLPLSGLWIMLSYITAQFLIVRGLMRHHPK